MYWQCRMIHASWDAGICWESRLWSTWRTCTQGLLGLSLPRWCSWASRGMPYPICQHTRVLLVMDTTNPNQWSFVSVCFFKIMDTTWVDRASWIFLLCRFCQSFQHKHWAFFWLQMSFGFQVKRKGLTPLFSLMVASTLFNCRYWSEHLTARTLVFFLNSCKETHGLEMIRGNKRMRWMVLMWRLEFIILRVQNSRNGEKDGL